MRPVFRLPALSEDSAKQISAAEAHQGHEDAARPSQWNQWLAARLQPSGAFGVPPDEKGTTPLRSWLINFSQLPRECPWACGIAPLPRADGFVAGLQSTTATGQAHQYR
jgi:hypothetical protein